MFSATRRSHPERVCLIDASGERTIATMGTSARGAGSDRLPWHLERSDAVYVTAGDEAAVRHARAARVVVATPLSRPSLAGVRADALVGSDRDPAERHEPEELAPYADLVVLTQGARTVASDRRRPGAAVRRSPPPAPIVDTYGSGDSFQAGLTFALGSGLAVEEALALAARWGPRP